MSDAEGVKKSVSMPADLFEQAEGRARQLRYRKFSHYVQALIEDDCLRGGAHVRGLGTLQDSSSSDPHPEPSPTGYTKAALARARRAAPDRKPNK
jgi:hypothetical protein